MVSIIAYVVELLAYRLPICPVGILVFDFNLHADRQSLICVRHDLIDADSIPRFLIGSPDEPHTLPLVTLLYLL